MDGDPYRTPQSEQLQRAAPAAVEADRRSHIQVERDLATLGKLSCLFGAGMSLLALIQVFQPIAAYQLIFDISPLLVKLSTILLLTLIAAVHLWVGVALHTRQSSARVPTSVVAALWMLVFPFGTAVGGWTLWRLWSARGKRVYAPDYLAVIEATSAVSAERPLVRPWLVGVSVGLGIMLLLLFAVL